MNPEGSVFFKGGKERILTCTFICSSFSFCWTFTSYKARAHTHTRTHTHTHTHVIPYQMTREEKKREKQDDVACCTRKKETLHTESSDRQHEPVRLYVCPSQAKGTHSLPPPPGPLSGCPLLPLGSCVCARAGQAAERVGDNEKGGWAREQHVCTSFFIITNGRGCSPRAHRVHELGEGVSSTQVRGLSTAEVFETIINSGCWGSGGGGILGGRRRRLLLGALEEHISQDGGHTLVQDLGHDQGE